MKPESKAKLRRVMQGEFAAEQVDLCLIFMDVFKYALLSALSLVRLFAVPIFAVAWYISRGAALAFEYAAKYEPEIKQEKNP
jgi:hypothetical protein